jgi:hypothetical protein
MRISETEFDTLCNIARALNNEEEEIDRYDLWQQLNYVINNIEED